MPAFSNTAKSPLTENKAKDKAIEKPFLKHIPQRRHRFKEFSNFLRGIEKQKCKPNSSIN